MSNVRLFPVVHLSKQCLSWFQIIVDLDDDDDDDGDDNDDDDANNEEGTLLNAMTTVVHLDPLLIYLSMQNDNDGNDKNSDNDDNCDNDNFDDDYEYEDHSACVHLCLCTQMYISQGVKSQGFKVKVFSILTPRI